ncbi:1-deoxy-D-xylulose-5-phosphate reductoisomerase [Myxococcota bacterium]
MGNPLGIVILGATGSIGRQTLEVVGAYPDRFRVVGLSAHQNAEQMAELVARHQPEAVALVDASAADRLEKLFGKPVESGRGSLVRLATSEAADIVVVAVVGQAGLEPVHAAVQAGKKVAIANKESLVMAGELIMKAAVTHGAQILPVDSEHAAVRQLLAAVSPEQIRRVVLTASGGPFRGRSREELEQVTAKEALAHPNWDMGDKVTIDSATLMNKGLEVIEAHWLFGLPPERIDVVIHPESIVHALVETVDGSVIAQMAVPDMRAPIAYALGCPDRLDLPERIDNFERLSLIAAGKLTFEKPDDETFPAIQLCRRALARGGGVPAALSAADEEIVAAFLKGRIRFTAITDILSQVLAQLPDKPIQSLGDVLEAARQGADLARTLLGALSKK